MTNLTTDAKNNLIVVKGIIKEALLYNTILADVCFAQAILESGLTKSPPAKLALEDNNLFGIKGYGLHGKFAERIGHEYIHGKWLTFVHEKWAKNDSIEESVEQWKQLMNLPRYHNLHNVGSFEEAAKMLVEDGYATDPKYSNKLIKIYEEVIK